MDTAQLFQALTAGGCLLLQDGEQLPIQDPRHMLTDALRQAIREQKGALLAMLTQPVPGTDAVTTRPGNEVCTHLECFPPGPHDGPTRQCRTCPHVWQV